MINGLNQKNRPVAVDRFSMVPRGDVPRATFATQHSLKTTINASFLYPILVDEVLPGDVHKGDVTIFARLATPLFPIMDSLELETHFFFVPNRLLWTNWVRMMGERPNPSDSIAFTVPVITGGAWAVASIGDYMGLPTVGGPMVGTMSTNALPFRAYNLIYNEWFRDQNLQTARTVLLTDGPDPAGNYALMRRNKRHDYFTSALPWPTKNNDIPNIPLAGLAAVQGIAVSNVAVPTAGSPGAAWQDSGSGTASGWTAHFLTNTANIGVRMQGVAAGTRPMIFADLSTAQGVALNALRLAVASQQLLERDARGGTRYTELLRNHFGVTPEDSRLNRPEYVGGGKTRMQTQAIPQTSPSTGAGNTLGQLGAAATASDQHRFSYAAPEHGWIIGLVSVRGDVTYQQGVERKWTRSTRYDYYWPAFAHLGEQVVRNDEIFCTGTPATDAAAFGYQERWAEYRHRPSRITGLFKSDSAGTLQAWHLAEDFAALPALNGSFIEDKTFEILQRTLAAGALANNAQLLVDTLFNISSTRAMPVYSVPGLDRF